MKATGLQLGRFRGINIGMSLGAIPMLALVTVLLATSVLPRSTPGHIPATYWSVSIIVSMLFMVTILVHELGHAFVARHFDIKVKGITLWLLGGAAELDSEPHKPGAAFLIAIAGPLASLGSGGVSLGAAWAMNAVGGPDIYVAGLSWLGLICIVVGVANLLPGMPLDGGHVLAAIVWKIRGNRTRGQIAAAVAGRFVALAIMALGTYELYRTGSWLGMWNVGMGFMLLQSARYHERFLRLEESLGDSVVGDVMDQSPGAVTTADTVARAVESAQSSGHQSAVPILDWSGRVVALVELADLYRIPRVQWDQLSAMSATHGNTDFVVAAPTERAVDLMNRMEERNHRHAAVVLDGVLIGLIGPEQLVNRSERASA